MGAPIVVASRPQKLTHSTALLVDHVGHATPRAHRHVAGLPGPLGGYTRVVSSPSPARQSGRSAAPRPHMPSDVHDDVTFFDRFARGAANFFSRPWFFALCVLLVLIWAPSFFVIESVDTWQLIINTATTIVTFLMVALLQNTQTRADQSTQDKLNAIADGLADPMKSIGRDDPELNRDMMELRAAVGLEDRESARK